jgi:DUF1680 family protein
MRAYVDAVSDEWLKAVPFSNPAILEMFRDRDREPKRQLLPWSGEFAGKYLTSAVQIYRLTHDEELRGVLTDFVRRFVALQADDGYLGPWPKENRLTQRAPNVGIAVGEQPPGWEDFDKTWDAQGHYHSMLGLLLWHEETGDKAALASARRIGDLLWEKFQHVPLVDFEPEPAVRNNTEHNQAPIHSLSLLYGLTGEERYLTLALKIREEFAAVTPDGVPVAGDYVNGTLAGKEFHELPKPRWESLYPVVGLAELTAITGDARSFEALNRMWWSTLEWDRHNNGGYTTGENVVGNPYAEGPIETCCLIAWLAFGVEMLRLTGDSVIADELEFSTVNSAVGSHSPNGRWVTYDTPMDGTRRSSTQDITFQAREGSPELNCCSAHGPRSLGMVSDWALMATDGGVILNWYGPGSVSAPLGDNRLTLSQRTDYPRGNQSRVTVELDAPARFALSLRIPFWSRATEVRVNGESVDDVVAGRYLVLEREWRTGDVIELAFDFSLQYWVGERERDGKVSIYRGPVLLTYDRRFNEFDPDDVPALDGRELVGELVESDAWFPPIVLMEFTATDGRAIRLCDFGSAGVGGSPYISWLDVRSCAPTAFTRQNPRRSSPVAMTAGSR